MRSSISRSWWRAVVVQRRPSHQRHGYRPVGSVYQPAGGHPFAAGWAVPAGIAPAQPVAPAGLGPAGPGGLPPVSGPGSPVGAEAPVARPVVPS